MAVLPRDDLTWQDGAGIVLAAVPLGVVAGPEGLALAAGVGLLLALVPAPLVFGASQGGALAVLGSEVSLLQLGAVEAGLFAVLLGSLGRAGGRGTVGVGLVAFAALAAVALAASTVWSGVLFVAIVALAAMYALSPGVGVFDNE